MNDLARIEKRKQARQTKRTDQSERSNTWLDTHGRHIVTHNVHIVVFDNQVYAHQSEWKHLGWLHWCRHTRSINLCRKCEHLRHVCNRHTVCHQFVILESPSGLLVVDTATLTMTHVFVLSTHTLDCKTIACKDDYFVVDHISANRFAAFRRNKYLCVFNPAVPHQSVILYNVLAWHSISLTKTKFLLCVYIDTALQFYSIDDKSGRLVCQFVTSFNHDNPNNHAWSPRFVHSTGCQATCQLDMFVRSDWTSIRIFAANVKSLVIDVVRKTVLKKRASKQLDNSI